MNERMPGVFVAGLMVVWAVLMAASCADEAQTDQGSGSAGGPATGVGGSHAGGMTADAGSGATGASGGSTEPDCPHQGPPVIDPSSLDDCSPACGGAHCVPAQLVPPDQQAQLAPCTTGGGDGFCTPDAFIETAGNFIPASCVSVAGAEGRCLSECLPDVAAQAVVLPVATCAAGERCVPCFDPQTQEDTGACNLSCDPGPQSPPVELGCPWTGPPVIDPSSLPACSPACGGAHCLPAAYVPQAQQGQLASCPGGFCVPDPLIETGSYHQPASCTPFPNTTAEGRCLSECIPEVAAQASQLSQGSCATEEYCVPCNDPFDGSSTGACTTTSCDQPTLPPYTFPTCCPFQGSDQATCVPSSLVPSGQQGDLNQLSCPSSFLCVPNEYLPTPTAPISTCFGLLGPGACVSECANVPGIFGQNGCPGNHVCVPCLLAPSTPGC